MAGLISVIEIGATNLRRADVFSENVNIKINNFYSERSGNLTPDKLFDFVKGGLSSQQKIVYAVAGPVKDHEIVEMLPNLPSFPKNFNLKEQSEKRFKIPAMVINDMTAAVLGMAYLLGKGKAFWGITWSTGIGGKFFDGQKIIDEDLEIGHLEFDLSPAAPVCGCGGRGHIEALISGSALEKKAGQNLRLMTENFKAGKYAAIGLYEEAAKTMGAFLARLYELEPANLFVFKGSVAANILPLDEIEAIILSSLRQKGVSEKVSLILSPDRERDTFFGAARIS